MSDVDDILAAARAERHKVAERLGVDDTITEATLRAAEQRVLGEREREARAAVYARLAEREKARRRAYREQMRRIRDTL